MSLGISPTALGQDQTETTETSETGKETTTKAIFDVKNLPNAFQNSESQLKSAASYFSGTSISQEIKIASKAHAKKVLEFSKDSTRALLAEENFSGLENKKTHWLQFKNENEKLTEQVNSAIFDLQANLEICNSQNTKWNNTLAIMDTSAFAKSTFERIASLQTMAHEITIVQEDSLLVLYTLGDYINEQGLFINDVLNRIDIAVSEQQKNVFAVNSLPFTKAFHQYTGEGARAAFRKKRDAIYQDLTIFIEGNEAVLYIHLVLVVIIYVLMFLLRRWFVLKAPEMVKSHSIGTIVLEYPGWSSFLISFLLFFFLYPTRPTVITDLLAFSAAIPVVVILPKFVPKGFHKYVYIGVTLMFLDLLQSLILPDDFFVRLDFLLESILAGTMLTMAMTKKSPLRHREKSIYYTLVNALIPILLLLIIVSFISNMAGAVYLARITVKSVVRLISGGIIIFLAAKILESLFLLFLDSKMHKNSVFLSRYQEKSKFYVLGGIRVWLILLIVQGFLKNLLIYEWVTDTWNEFLSIGYQFGEVTLNIGHLVNFGIIIIIFSFLSRFVQVLIAEEILGRFNIQKGLPLAIGIVSKYFILLLGFLMAVAAMGIDLNKLSFIIGALGVGIGFGLQNIIGNFISGLILIFERPIHIGDIIIVENYEGTVTEIGIRASKVKTWDGAEVVVPNMNLISNSVTNWTLSDQLRRRTLYFYTSPEANPTEVIEMIRETVDKHPNIKTHPEPLILYQGYKDFYNVFRVLYWLAGDMLMTDSAVSSEVYNKLKEKGYHVNPQHPVFYKPQDSVPGEPPNMTPNPPKPKGGSAKK
ncbi:MAG: hypothetical protein SchgKO_04240 [Schleiferiaceae bacterium]